MRSQRGATLVEMLVALAMPALMAGGAKGATRVPADTARDSIDRIIAQAMAVRPGCTIAAAIAPNAQPLAVYASISTFSFVTECLTSTPTPRDRFASSPVASTGPAMVQTVAWAPAFAAPSVPTQADTVTFFFQPDNTTPRKDDFLLLRQVNTQRPEVVTRNVLTYPGRPFFQYFYRGLAENGRTALVPGSWLPLWHLQLDHGTDADTGTAARIDLLRAVQVNYRLSNGKAGDDERVRTVEPIIPLTSLTPTHRQPCGYDQLFTQASAVAIDPVDEIAQLFMGGMGEQARGASGTGCGSRGSL